MFWRCVDPPLRFLDVITHKPEPQQLSPENPKASGTNRNEFWVPTERPPWTSDRIFGRVGSLHPLVANHSSLLESLFPALLPTRKSTGAVLTAKVSWLWVAKNRRFSLQRTLPLKPSIHLLCTCRFAAGSHFCSPLHPREILSPVFPALFSTPQSVEEIGECEGAGS